MVIAQTRARPQSAAKRLGNTSSRIGEAQKERILRVASQLLAKASYSEMTVDDIARVARINKALVYYYFKNKAFLVYEVACRTIRSNSFLDPVMASDLEPRDKLRELVIGHIKWRIANPEIGGITQKDLRYLPGRLQRDYIALRDRHENVFRQVIAEGINKGQFKQGNAKVLTMFTLGFINSIDRWFKPEGDLSSSDVASLAWDYVSKALSCN